MAVPPIASTSELPPTRRQQPPVIFDPARRIAARKRMRYRQTQLGAARFVIDNMVDDVFERLVFLRVEPSRALVVGDWTSALSRMLEAGGTTVDRADPAPSTSENAIDEERPFADGQYDLVVSLGLLDTVNDLPGALIHIRNTLVPGGLAIAALMGAGSLPVLRSAMLAADGDRPAARLHPMVDVRAGAQLIQRAGWADPVVDGHAIRVRYASFVRLVGDIRDQALGNVLVSRGPRLSQDGWGRAHAAFAAHAEPDGRVSETFEIVTLSGRKPLLERGF